MADLNAIFPALIAHVSEGKTVSSFLRLHGVNSGTLHRWLERHLTQRTELMRARELGAHAMADDAVDIADEELDAQRARIRTDIRKWHAGVTMPKVFGPKMDLNVTQTVDLSGALIEARKRALPPVSNPAQITDAQVIDTHIIPRIVNSDIQSVEADSGQDSESAWDVFK